MDNLTKSLIYIVYFFWSESILLNYFTINCIKYYMIKLNIL